MKNHFIVKREVIPALSEKVVQLPTREKGVRFLDSQEIQGGVFVARCLTECVNGQMTCLIVNTTHTELGIFLRLTVRVDIFKFL